MKQNSLMFSWLFGAFALTFAPRAFAQLPGYTYVQSLGSSSTMVTYTNPSDPTWVYVYWIGRCAGATQEPFVVHLPLTGIDLSAQAQPNEGIRRMDQAGLLRNAITKFSSLIVSRNYSAGIDPDFQSFSTLVPVPSSISLMHILQARDPELEIKLKQTRLDQLPTDIDQLNILARSIHLPLAGATLNDFAKKVASYQISWRTIAALGAEDTLVVLLEQLAFDLKISSERMHQSWIAQRSELTAGLATLNQSSFNQRP